MDRLVDRLRTRAAQRFVGRHAELALIDESLATEPPPVSLFLVHGPGGIGKTSLLERARVLAAGHGLDAVRLDARDVEPSAPGLLRALGAALGLAPQAATLAGVLAACRQAPRRLLLIDTFEAVAHLEGWLRAALLPELPAATRVILAGRHVPDAAWRTDPLWREGARVIALRNLAPEDCARFLAARGVDAAQHARMAALSHGHPLALALLADVAAAGGEVPASHLGPDIVRQLAARFTACAPGPAQRRALEVCAHARVTTEALLAETVDPAQAHALFDWLAALPFVECGPGGLFPHDVVRDAIDDELHWRDRERHREIHRAVRAHLLARAAADPQLTFDILFLHRHAAAMRPFVDFRALGSVYFERGHADDLPALRALMAAELPAAQHAALAHWWCHRAASPWAIRSAPGELVGATLSIDLAALCETERASDPVFAAAWRALQRAAPPRPGDLQLLARWNLARGGQRQASAAMNALQMAQFHEWLTLPRLGSFTICVEHPAHWAPMFRHLGFQRLDHDGELAADGVPLGCYTHDWRAAPLSQWIDGMAERELGRAPAEADAEAPARQRLSQPDFERAVRDALRALHDAAALAASPLTASVAVSTAREPGEPAGQALRRLLHEAAQALRERPRDEKFWRALELTYFRPAGSQELAAERLGLPFGTYRYQLATGIERVVQALWARETA
jgi:hypothetical protein